MKNSVILILLLQLIAACSSTHNLTSPRGSSSDSEFNNFAKDETAKIILINDSVYKATNVNLSAETLCWNNSKTRRKVCKSCSEINSVIFKNEWLGGLEGAGFGVIGGGTVGLVTGIINPNLDSDWGSGSTAAIYSILGAIGGTLIGFTAGMIMGHTYEYEFQGQGEINKQK